MKGVNTSSECKTCCWEGITVNFSLEDPFAELTVANILPSGLYLFFKINHSWVNQNNFAAVIWPKQTHWDTELLGDYPLPASISHEFIDLRGKMNWKLSVHLNSISWVLLGLWRVLAIDLSPMIHLTRWLLDLLKCLKPSTTGIILAILLCILYKNQKFRCATIDIHRYPLSIVASEAHAIDIK